MEVKRVQEMTLGVGHLIGPRVVAAGTVSLAEDGTATVYFPTLDGVAADYIALATDTNATQGAVNVTTFTTSTLALKGTNDHSANWAIIKVGF